MEGATKTIVVVEDELLTRMLAVEVLQDAGFKVIEAQHAADALAALEVHSSEISLLFADIQMPGTMTGLDLASYVNHHWPHISLLITSANSKPVLPAGSRFLPKPYETNTLDKHARELTA